MKKKYFVILNSVIIANESSLVDAVKLANSIINCFPTESPDLLNYQTIYTNIKAKDYYQKLIPVKYSENMPATNMILSIQEIDF
ncbi:hypothetical protein EBZ38_05505 [bacterium]|nr:hypothetical protein [bacterium]